MDTKECTMCHEVKPLSRFGQRTQNGRRYPTTRCYDCRYVVRKEKGWVNTEAEKASWRKSQAKRSAERKANVNTAQFIYEDTRRDDRKKNRPNDLDKPFIEGMIQQPCHYCGATDLRMTLDRIDNEGGHTKDNVVQACYRCNHTRGDMPYVAWVFLTEGMRKAREAGAFGDWATQPISRRGPSNEGLQA